MNYLRSTRLHKGAISGVVTGLLAVSGFAMLPAPQAHAAGCTIPTSDVGVTAKDEAGTNDQVHAYDRFRIQVELTHLDGMQGGCQTTVQLPDYFSQMPDTTLYLNADGTSSTTRRADTVATMVIDADSRTMTMTLTDYASTHKDVTATGWTNASIDSTIPRGTTKDVEVKVNGTSVPVGQISTGTCTTDCPTVPTAPVKWGVENGGEGFVIVEVQKVADAGTKVSVSDQLTSAGQNIKDVASVNGYDCVNSWGDPGIFSNGSCDTNAHYDVNATTTGSDVTFVSDHANEFFRVTYDMAFTGSGPWTDTATIKVQGQPDSTASTTVYSYAAGGTATGDTYNLSLKKQLTTSGPFKIGQTVTYMLQTHNDGPATANKGWTVTDVAPAGLKITGMSGSGFTCSVASATCTSLSPLRGGENAKPITVTAQITPAAKGVVHNVAYVAPAPGDAPETNPLGSKPTSSTNTDNTPTDNDSQADLRVTTQPKAPEKTFTRSFQVDRYNPIVSGNPSATTYLKNLVASLDNDGVLKYREDMGNCKAKSTCLWNHATHQIVTVSVKSGSTPTTAQWIKAVNAATNSTVGDVFYSGKITAVGRPITIAWSLGNGASASSPWGPKMNVNQTFLAHN